jgi:hypothetical protein
VWAIGDELHPADTCYRCEALSNLEKVLTEQGSNTGGK